jgi:anti-sigma B factor antagonist
MDDLYKLREYGRHTVISFYTPTLMNAAEVERVRGDLIRLVDEGRHEHLVLDFTRVQFFSSQVIGILLTLHKKLTAPAAGGTFSLCGVGPQLLELLKISRLDKVLTIKASRKEAVSA